MNKQQYVIRSAIGHTVACLSFFLLVSCTPRTMPAPVSYSDTRNTNTQQANTQNRSLCGAPYPISAARWANLQKPYQQNGQWFTPLQQAKGFVEEGEAAWYGDNLQGQLTASGEVVDKNKMTAAHPGLPMNTCVKVTNLANGYWIILRINDRGPFTGERIIDVSEAAAKYIGFFKQGLTRVRIEVLP